MHTPPTRQTIHVNIKGRTKRSRPLSNKTSAHTPTTKASPHSTTQPKQLTPFVNITQACPPKHPKHSMRPCRNSEYMVEWCPLTCPYNIAQTHQQNGTQIAYSHISLLFATNRSITREEPYPPCFHCLRGEGDPVDFNLIQCERCLRWIHSQCLPRLIPKDQIILAEGWTCHECEPPSTLNPCPHKICTIQFPPTPHTVAFIHKL